MKWDPREDRNTRIEPCKVDRLTLSEYVDGELGFFRHRLVSRHLRHCESCRERLSELKAADAIIHLARDRVEAGEEGGGETELRLPGRLQVELGIGPANDSGGPFARARARRRWVRPVVAAAALVFALAAGFVALHYPAREAGELLALGMENRARASVLLDTAEEIEVQILGIRMQLIQENLNPEERATIEERLVELSELVVSFKADARRYMRAYEAAVAAVERQDRNPPDQDPGEDPSEEFGEDSGEDQSEDAVQDHGCEGR